MVTALISFIVSAIANLLLIRYQHLHEHISGDSNLRAPQKVHTKIVPRIGGLGIFLSLAFTFIYLGITHLHHEFTVMGLLLILASLPVFIAGIAEDLFKNIGVKLRLLAGLISGYLLILLFQIQSLRVDIWGLDALLQTPIGLAIFICIAVAGLSNAYNIIDGFNGLASMVGMISLLGIASVAFKVGDIAIVNLALILIGSVLGFFIWNYPKGFIFLGDGGAYLIGFAIAALSILLVVRHVSVSPWFALMINAYPILETLFTIWRRRVHHGKNPGLPDAAHFHSLIYRRIVRWANANNHSESSNLDGHYSSNAKTSPYLWMISSMGVVPAVLWWNRSDVLILCALFFIALYLYLYFMVVRSYKRRPPQRR